VLARLWRPYFIEPVDNGHPRIVATTSGRSFAAM
jgi:hypothetical protein